MDIDRGSSPSSPIQIHDQSHSPAQRQTRFGRTPGWTSQPSLPTPMAVPGYDRRRNVPPALPPPKYLHNLDPASDDPGWNYAHPRAVEPTRFREPSAVVPSQFPKSWGRDSMADDGRIQDRRRQSSNSTVRSLTDSERRYDSRTDEGYYSLSSSTSLNPQSVDSFYVSLLSVYTNRVACHLSLISSLLS